MDTMDVVELESDEQVHVEFFNFFTRGRCGQRQPSQMACRSLAESN